MKNNSTKPRDLTENGQLTLSQEKTKKGEHAADDDDGDGCGENQCVTRPSDSNTMLWGIASQDSVYIALSTYQTGIWGVGEDTDSQHDAFSSPSWVSHLSDGPSCDKQGFR